MAVKPKGRPTGRPSIYSEALAERICTMLAEGESLVAVCKRADMPARANVLKWMAKDAAFEARIARAREAQADYMDDLILETAKQSTAANFQANKVKIDAYKWRAARLAPKKYGDRSDLNITGTLQTMPQEALDARINDLLRKLGTGDAALRALAPPREDET